MACKQIKRKAGISLPFLLLFVTIGYSQEKKALLIGIDQYIPEYHTDLSRGSNWYNLDGCINDVDAMKSVLTCRYGFKENDMVILRNGTASRAAILNNLDALAKESGEGDIILVFYSGHGSQVRNSKAAYEDRGTDEAIVPADAASGVPYIRDKELALAFNYILDKGAILTVILDCCHSGSMSRGLAEKDPPKSRFLPMDTIDIKDATRVEFTPGEKGALILSAAQDDELASEIRNDYQQPQGAFTYALLKALSQSSANESAGDLFKRTASILKNKGKRQIPVIEGKQERLQMTLIGEKPTNANSRIHIPVLKTDPNSNTVELQGGVALSLTDSSELVKKGSPTTRVKIIQLKGLTSSIARCVTNNIDNIKPGDLFELALWGMPDEPNLCIYAPPGNFSYQEILNQANELRRFASSQKIAWITDPTSQTPNYTIAFSDKGWQITDQNHITKSLGVTINSENLKKIIKGKNTSLFAQLPPFRGLLSYVQVGNKSVNNAIEYTDASNANYYLTGRLGENVLEYAWVSPGRLEADTAYQTTLPTRTNWQVVQNDTNSIIAIAENLTLWALKLGKINSWLNLSPPIDDNSFPYLLALKNIGNNHVKTSGKLFDQEIYGLVLKAKPNGRADWDGESRWIYVFSIDKAGTMNLLFPQNSNVENKFPTKEMGWQEEIQLGRKALFKIGAPFGLDTYFMIASLEPITDPQNVFNSEGVRSAAKGKGTTLSNLFSNTGANQRGAETVVPANWTLQKTQFISVPK